MDPLNGDTQDVLPLRLAQPLRPRLPLQPKGTLRLRLVSGILGNVGHRQQGTDGVSPDDPCSINRSGLPAGVRVLWRREALAARDRCPLGIKGARR